MKNKFTQIPKWLAVIGLILSNVLLVLKFCNTEIPYFPQFSFSWLIIFVFISGIVSFLLYQIESINKFTHLYFIKPFFETSKHLYITIFFILWILLLPFAFLIHYFTPEKIEISAYFGYFGIWLTFLGLIITQRIYFEIKYKINHNFEEFVNTLEDFIRVSKNKDEIYLILPTLFIGATGYPRFNSNFRKKIETLASDKNKKLSIGVLDFDKEEIKKILDFKKEKNIVFGNTIIEDNEMNEISFMKMILESKAPLIRFHQKWNKFDGNSTKKSEFYFDLLSFMNRLIELENESSNDFHINKIKKNYFNYELNDTSNGDKGIFLFANTKQNMFYLGTIKIYAQEKINFQNTIIEEIELDKEFETIFDTFVKERC